ncbi:MAG: copper-translocating P-type ATPase [Oscillospiraceae bacterium]|nr:copper-translocating P-type ATPase [Oscillospiraceae bacterium]
MKEEIYLVEGMTCAACSGSVERVTRKMDGVERSDVNLVTKQMTICYDESKVTPEAIMKKVERAGFQASLWNPDAAKKEEKETVGRKTVIFSLLLSALLMYISMGQMMKTPLPVPHFLDIHANPAGLALTEFLLTFAVIILGRDFFLRGFKALKSKSPTMDTLVAIGSGCSFIYSVIITALIVRGRGSAHDLYYESSAMVIALVMLGKFLEAGSQKKTRGAIEALMALTPETALVLQDGEAREVPVAMLKHGDLLLVKSGARFPADGIITEGSCSVNESMLTGESLPVEKSVGDRVTGGSVSVSGAVTVQADRVGKDTTVSQIVRLVEEAQGKKAPVSRLADKISAVFVPAVIAIALVASVVWSIAGQDIGFVLRIFTSILVIACPCALGLATPTAILVGTGLGASNGILIRSGECLETASSVDTVVFDKTGTITTGVPVLTGMYPCGDTDRGRLLALAAAAEERSEHPLAKAVLAAAEGMELPALSDFAPLTGLGVEAKLPGGGMLLVGNARLMRERGIDLSCGSATMEEAGSKGETAICVAAEGKLLGILTAADSIRPTAKEAVSQLRAMGKDVVLLTGDSKAAAEHTAKLAGIDTVFAGVLPHQKADTVRTLQEGGKTVMMVGDGVNDAPALTQANVGVAMGGGSDIAVESGDIVLMHADPVSAAKAIRLSKHTMRHIRQNLFWAFCYNTITIPVAAGVLYPFFGILLNPMIAGFCMSLSSICVVLNALRLRRKKL